MRLWRPVGAKELVLIEASAWRRFPPRLPDQPIFYPVLNFDYAEQIARDWNARGDEEGYVLEFDVEDEVARRYPEQTAGAANLHRELWVPAEELEMFNDAIQGPIRLVARYARGARVEAEA
ncbi:hypothetical protein [Terricaulis sp.]|uniref:hypothetical protein n=1 Tax=Terricaulis sp. TaxID=2768686 RepID=UPI0037835D6B